MKNKFSFLRKIDPKGIKFFICALLAVVVYSLLNLVIPMQYPLFILNTVFVVIQMNLALTKTSSLERIVGTVLAITVGLGCYFLSAGALWIIPIGLVLAALISFLFFGHLVNVLLLCAVMLMLNTSGGHPLDYAAVRIINTIIGLVIAIGVAALYTHPYAREPIYDQYRTMLSEISVFFEQFQTDGTITPPQVLYAKLAELMALETKITRDTGVFSISFRKTIIKLSNLMNQMISQIGVLQELPADNISAIKEQRVAIQQLNERASLLLQELSLK